MKNVEERGRYWGERVSQIADNYFRMPIGEYHSIFEGKKILEIGPGTGRHMDELLHYASAYSVADISEGVLRNFKCDRFHITGYDIDFKQKFDVIVFWYVIHHVRHEELGEFIDMLKRHLTENGYLMFNIPSDLNKYDKGTVGSDGMLTTPWNAEEVKRAFEQTGFRLVAGRHQNIDSYIMVWQHGKDWNDLSCVGSEEEVRSDNVR